MKTLFSICFAVTLLASCAPAHDVEPTICSNGFAPSGNAITMGSESSVDLVKAIYYWAAVMFATVSFGRSGRNCGN